MRGKVYFDQVRSIFTESDPSYQAQQQFLDVLEEIAWNSALEVGCGFGWHLRAMRMRYPDKQITGVDFSLSQLTCGLEYLQESNVLIGQADARHLPFADEAFDLVFTSGLLVNLHPTIVVSVLTELRRVSRRSVVLLEYAREHMDSLVRQRLMDDADWHGHCYTEVLAQVGLKLIKAFPFRAFEEHPDRVPWSCFYSEKVG
ncbi:MAG: class I SAM-dependent methyltransferase [Candidatus Omnitrophica bacterium]|nr:class I SAM-dependent methyltransferase [Candidatus Omnitrophota bacterium]